MNKSKLFYLGLGVVISATSCGENKPVTHTRQIDEACDTYDNCQNGLACENGICRQTCQANNECPDGYHCENTICAKGGYSSCGDGKEDTGEPCDDGNNLDGDGCSSKCNIEENYKCSGHPSVCKCADGFQDHDGDGKCLKDCESCGANKQCSYNEQGEAKGCLCSAGFQDSNNDGNCLPDCNCKNNQVCSYAADGSASCGCPEGMQDNDGDGNCSATCATFAPNNCKLFQGCDDSDGTAKCECVVYVKAGAEGKGSSWNDAIDLISTAVKTIEDNRDNPLNAEAFQTCNIWLTSDAIVETKTIELPDNISIIGGFTGKEYSPTERLNDLKTEISNYTITGTEKEQTTEYNRIFNVHGRTAFKDIAFKAGNKEGTNHLELRAAAIFADNSANVLIDSCDFSGSSFKNSTDNYSCGSSGGQIYFADSFATIINSRFVDNRSSGRGGAIGANNSTLQISGSLFANNYAGCYGNGDGGALYLENNSTITINNSAFIDNSGACYSGGKGGAIFNTKSTLMIRDSLFLGNNAEGGYGAGAGGAIYSASSESSRLTIENCFFNLNQTSSGASVNMVGPPGAAIYNSSSSSSINNSYFVSNRGNNNGGCYEKGSNGILNLSPELTITNTVFSDNNSIRTASNCKEINGTAINNYDGGSANITYSLFVGNKGVDSTNNTIYSNAKGSVNISNSLIDGSNENITSISNLQGVKIENIADYGTWLKVEIDTKMYQAKIFANDAYWTIGQLKGSFVFIDAEDPYYLPIIDNGTNYIVVPIASIAQTGSYAISSELLTNKTIVLRDFSKVTDLSGSQTTLIDQADSSAGPQPTTDINGNPRPQGAGPDIGPFEIQ